MRRIFLLLSLIPLNIWATSSFNFNGTNQEWQAINPIPDDSYNQTICAWFKPSSAHIGVYIDDRVNPGNGLVVYSDNSTGLVQMYYGECNVFTYSNVNVYDGNWHFVCANGDSVGAKSNLYVDGVFQNQSSCTLVADVPGNVGVGRDFEGGHYASTNGTLRIWLRNLSASEIKQAYLCADQPADVIGRWDQNNTNNIALDQSINHNDGTDANFPSQSTDSPPLSFCQAAGGY